MKKTKFDWIVLKYDVQPNEFVCERCKRRQPLPDGALAISIFEAMGNAFTKIHKRCTLNTENDILSPTKVGSFQRR